MIYHVTCSTDDNYLQHCMAMLCSLYENNMAHDFCLHLLVSSLSEDGRNLISGLGNRYNNKTIVYNIDDSLVENVKMNTKAKFNGEMMYSIATYYRIFLPSLLSNEIDKVLYLDCDIIVLKDVSELFNLNMEGYGVAAVKDASPYDSYHRNKMGLGMQHDAFCAGIMMINLDYWRKNHAQESLLEYSTREWKSAYLQDQDALNYVFRNHWLMLPYKWGKTPLCVAPIDRIQRSFDVSEYANSPCIIHYSSHAKPWYDFWFEERNYYWKYVRLSGYPDVKVVTLKTSLKIQLYVSVARYSINKYIRPCVPNVLELLIKDIINVLKFFLSCIRGPKVFNKFLLNRWKEKYNM